MAKTWMTIEIPPGYQADIPKVYQENGQILSVFVKLKPKENGSENRSTNFDYKFGRKPDGSGYGFINQNPERWRNSGKAGGGLGLLIKGFFNVFGSKK